MLLHSFRVTAAITANLRVRCKVVKLQGKWIGQVISRIFSSKGEHVEDSLKALVPAHLDENGIQSQVLSADAAEALWYLHILVHRSGDIEGAVEGIAHAITKMSIFSRSLQKVPSMTQFKKLVHSARQVLSMKVLDSQVESQVKEVQEELNALLESVEDVASRTRSDAGDGGSASSTFKDIIHLMEGSVNTKSKAAKLPQDQASRHWAIVKQTLAAIEEESWARLLFSYLHCEDLAVVGFHLWFQSLTQ